MDTQQREPTAITPRNWWWGGESGVSSTELAVLMPALIGVILVIFQMALWWHGKQAADTAAEEGVEAAQIAGATTADGVAGVAAILNHAGHLSNVRVGVTRGTDRVVVEVRGDALRLVPGLSWSVASRAEGSIERFIPEPDR